ncbi:MAG: glycosyltransferase family 2 protein [Pyrinomonadaceae bacterium]
MPRASIIITTHNRPQLVPRAIASARAAGADVEIIVVDDASTDETEALCKLIPDVNYVRLERNQGVAGARNVGLVASTGEYITFLDDDDLRLSGSLDQQIEALCKTPEAMFCYAQAIPEERGRQGEPYPAQCPQGDILWELLVRNFISCGTVVFRRACISRVGLLDDVMPGIDDWDLWIRISELFSVLAVQTPVLISRQSTPTSGQGSSDTVRLIARGRKYFREKWLKLPRVQAERERRKETWRRFSKNVAEHLAWVTFYSLSKGEICQAVRSAHVLLQLHPSGLLTVLRRWTSPATFITLVTTRSSGSDLAHAKIRFKQIRSNSPRS